MTKIEITVDGARVSLQAKGENGSVNLGELLLAAAVFAASTAKKTAEASGNAEMAELHHVFEIAMEALEKDLK